MLEEYYDVIKEEIDKNKCEKLPFNAFQVRVVAFCTLGRGVKLKSVQYRGIKSNQE